MLLAAAIIGLGAAAPAVHGQLPEGLSGTVIVLNKQGDDAHFIDLSSGETVGVVATGRGPHELVVSQDGRIAVGTDYEGPVGSLSVFDIEQARRSSVIDLSPYTRPHGIVFLPGDSLVAVTVERDRAVLVVRIADGEITKVLPTEAQGSHMVAAPADGRTLWTGDIASNTVTELDVATGRVLRKLDAPSQPEAINVTPNGDRVFAGSNAEGTVTVFATADGSSQQVATGFRWPYRMFLTPGAEQLIVPDLWGNALRFFDGRTYEELGRLDFPGEIPQGLTLHDNGRHLFLSLSAGGRIAVVDISTRDIVGYLPGGAGPDGIGYSRRSVAR